MTTHVLKSWPEFFGAVHSGAKWFELRRNDRDFKIGDVLNLHEFEPNSEIYTGRTLTRRVNYIMHGVGSGGVEPLRGLSQGYVILGMELA